MNRLCLFIVNFIADVDLVGLIGFKLKLFICEEYTDVH